MKKLKVGIKTLCAILATVILLEFAVPTAFALINNIDTFSSSGEDLPGVDYGDWDIPEVTENPYEVDSNVTIYPVYTTKIYEEILHNGFLKDVIWSDGGFATPSVGTFFDYQLKSFAYTRYSKLPETFFIGYNSKGHERDFTPFIQFGSWPLENGTSTKIMVDLSDDRDRKELNEMVSHLDKNQLSFVMGANVYRGKGSIYFTGMSGEYYATTGSGFIKLSVPYSVYEGDMRQVFYEKTSEANSAMSEAHMMMIDDTSPSVSSVDAWQEGRALLMTLHMNEGVRYAAYNIEDSLDDAWVDLELRVIGTEYTDTVRMFLSGIDDKKIHFGGDLGPFAGLDYEIVRVKDSSLAKKNYDVRIGTVTMFDNYFSNASLNITKAVDMGGYKSIRTVRTIKCNTTVVCDHAGNPLLLDGITNWTINGKQIKNDNTYVSDISIINEKTTVSGASQSQADSYTEREGRGTLFYGPADELVVHIRLNRQISEAEAETFVATTNIKTQDGELIKLRVREIKPYKQNGETYTLLIMESLYIPQRSEAVMEEGEEKPFFKITEVECTMTESPALSELIPGVRNNLYLDLEEPELTIKALDGGEPTSKNGYYTLSVEANVKDPIIAKNCYSGVAGTLANFYIGAGVLKDTDVYYLISDSPMAPTDPAVYDGMITLTSGGMTNITEDGYPLFGEGDRLFVHILIPEREGLLIDGFFVYMQAEDLVGNYTSLDEPCNIPYKIDKEAPTVTVGAPAVSYTTGSAAVTVPLGATDYSEVTRLRYQWTNEGESYDDGKWIVAPVDAASTVSYVYTEAFGMTGDQSKYDLTLWVGAADVYGNVGEPRSVSVKINLEKPGTSYEVKSDISVPDPRPEITVTAPGKSSDGRDGYTRVTLTPEDGTGRALVTVVRTGEQVDLFDFDSESTIWYSVKVSGRSYTEVKLLDDEALSWIKNYYGNVKVTFENAYSDLTPAVGYVNAQVTDGSYISDMNYVVVRYASQSDTLSGLNGVDFGQMKDREGKVLANDAEPGAKAPLFVSASHGINPSRGTQISFSLFNAKMSSWGLLDIDFDNSYVELVRENKLGERTVARQSGLAKSASQYFVVPAFADDGSYFDTGSYYLRVCVVSKSGSADSFVSSRFVVDISVPVGDGITEYGYTYSFDEEDAGYDVHKVDSAVSSMGIAVKPEIERMRSNVFAVYTAGVESFYFNISTNNPAAEYEGYSTGGVEGIRYWNALSKPSAEELDSCGYIGVSNPELLPAITVRGSTTSIYTEESIPKGADALNTLYLTEGVNVICYQIKMASGHESAVRQLVIIVTQYTPELNVTVDEYTASHTPSKNSAIVNAHDITLKVEEAFSLNGSGNVDIEVWSSYDMVVDGELVDRGVYRILAPLKGGLKVGSTVVITEDSYTKRLDNSPYCTALIVATDEYGGRTVVAPQVGSHLRVNDRLDATDEHYVISYDGGYQDDPFVIGRDLTYHTQYNQVQYYGDEIVGFYNELSLNNGPYKTVETSSASLRYNLFAIQSNDVVLQYGNYSLNPNGLEGGYVYSGDRELINYHIVNEATLSITITGDDLAEPVVIRDFYEPGTNAAGYLGASYGEIFYPNLDKPSEGYYEKALSLYMSNPIAPSREMVDRQVTRHFRIEGENMYGDPFVAEGTLYLKYIDYSASSVELTEHGTDVGLGFHTADGETVVRTGQFNPGDYILTVTDKYGALREVPYTVEANDYRAYITYSDIGPVSDMVEINIDMAGGNRIYVDVTDAQTMKVEYSDGNTNAKITLTENDRFTFRFVDENGNEIMKYLEVDNIVRPAPYLVYTVTENDIATDDEGNRYRYGSVTVYLQDDNFDLTDIYTGKAPSYTFVPGGEQSYTFKKEDIAAVLGTEEAINIPEDIVASIDYEILKPLSLDEIMPLNTKLPSVVLKGFTEDRGYYKEAKAAIVLDNGLSSDPLDDHILYTYNDGFANAQKLIESMGFSTSYRFLVEATHTDGVRVFVKSGYGSEVPDYESGVSDEIDGVILNGRLLTVTKNAQFTLYVVTPANVYAAIGFDIRSLGDTPIPTVVKVPLSESCVRAYILAPDGTDAFLPTSADPSIVIAKETEGDYAGCYYADYKSNDKYIINYTYTYKGATVTDSTGVNITEITRRELEQDGTIGWSANKADAVTGRNITAIIEFNEQITGYELEAGRINSDAVKIDVSGRQITVTYSMNNPEFTLRCISNYGSVLVTLDAVSNIDREPPSVELYSKTLSKDGREVEVIFMADEPVVFSEGGYIAEPTTVDGGRTVYLYTRVITENGTYTYSFIDLGGIKTTVSVTVNEIVSREIVTLYNTVKDENGAVSDPSELDLEVGDSFYLKLDRDATVSFDGGAIEVKAGDWAELKVTEGLGGLYPYVRITDGVGVSVMHQLSQIPIPDTEAPVIMLVEPIYYVSAGTSREVIEAALLKNFVAKDDKDGDGALTLSVSIPEDVSLSGTYGIVYTATDKSGNVAETAGLLKVLSGSEPRVHINGVFTARGGSYIATAGEEITMTVDVAGEPYRVYLESGIKTIAQMKIGATDITGYTTEESIDLGVMEAGFYTVIIQTQSRDYFRILIYCY